VGTLKLKYFLGESECFGQCKPQSAERADHNFSEREFGYVRCKQPGGFRGNGRRQ
jgi:hypothetical protein